MEINKETGYLEDTRQYNVAFDSDAKRKFIKYASDFIDKHKNFPPVSDICRALGIRTRTFYYHLNWDKAFKEDWKELQLRLESIMEQAIGAKALKPNNTIANIAALRRLTMGTERQGYWGGEILNPLSHNSPAKEILAQNDVIDAEIVPDPPQITQENKQ